MKRIASLVLFVVGLAALAAVVTWLRTREPQAAPEGGRPPFVLPVTVAEVRAGRVAPTVLLTGNVRSTDTADIGFEVEGRLESVAAEEAQHVAQGDELARLDDRDARIALVRAQAARNLAQKELDRLLAGERAEEKRRLAAEVESQRAAVELAGRELERGRELSAERIISPSQLDLLATTLTEARSSLVARQEELALAEAGTREEDIDVSRAMLAVRDAEVAEAELAVQKTVLAAPFDGVVSVRHVSVGDPVAARQTVFELVDLGRREIVVEIPARYAARLSPGARAVITADDLPDLRIETELDAIVPVADSLSGNLRGLVRFEPAEEPEGRLAPGFFVRVQLALRPVENALVVPADALRVTGSGTIVVLAAPPDPAPEGASEASAGPPPRAESGGMPPGLSAVWVFVRELASDESGTAIEVVDEGRGLVPGDQVVVVGVDRAFPGAPLLPRPSNSQARETAAPAAPAADEPAQDETP